ncbi:hypothetical protein TNIN_486191 [Trichonephila inaurata madagascariensis]|uniref:Uncharacterized protein n=1 Tax=Trichonephila inaurata madagascariensis TaxID=2747483 RepID=A0A8X6WMQ2_9ARAC|nr:hypothetical protein TNIN_486191 [Trichonephila inaurata madagascariensis]
MSDPRHRDQSTIGSHKGNPVPFSSRKSSPESFLFCILRVESMAVNSSGHPACEGTCYQFQQFGGVLVGDDYMRYTLKVNIKFIW